jgi:hypothetical protein
MRNASVGKKNSKLFKSRFSNFCFQRKNQKKRRNGFELFLPFQKRRSKIQYLPDMVNEVRQINPTPLIRADSQVHLPLKASSNPLHVFDASPNLSELSTLSTLPTASDVLWSFAFLPFTSRYVAYLLKK